MHEFRWISAKVEKTRARARERERERQEAEKTRLPVRGDHLRSVEYAVSEYTTVYVPRLYFGSKNAGTRIVLTRVSRDSSFSRLTELSSPNIEALFSLQRTTPLCLWLNGLPICQDLSSPAPSRHPTVCHSFSLRLFPSLPSVLFLSFFATLLSLASLPSSFRRFLFFFLPNESLLYPRPLPPPLPRHILSHLEPFTRMSLTHRTGVLGARPIGWSVPAAKFVQPRSTENR